MNKFNIGDKVVGNKNAYSHRIGQTGNIVELAEKPVGESLDRFWVDWAVDRP